MAYNSSSNNSRRGSYQSNSSKKRNFNSINYNSNNKVDFARSPYNFIPFPKEFFSKYNELMDIPLHNKLDHTRNTGYISYKIKAQTPIFIGGEIRRNDTVVKNVESFFYKIGDKYAIPGSSIKGKLRTNCEILSNSYPDFISDDKFSFRDMAGAKSSLKNEYRKYIKTDFENRINTVVKAGFIFNNGERSYLIYPFDQIKDNNGKMQNFLFLNNRRITGSVINKIAKNDLETRGYKPYMTLCSSKDFTNGVTVPNRETLNHCKVISEGANQFRLEDLQIALSDGGFILMNSGNIKGKKNHYLLSCNFDDKKPIRVPDQVIHNEFSRKNRVKGKDERGRDQHCDYYELPGVGYGKPCFYVEMGSEVKAVGFTPYMRIPYRYSIHNGIPETADSDRVISYADSMFGFTNLVLNDNVAESFKSRITCTHALSENNACDYEDMTVKYMLQKPKPTAFQNYLVQFNNNVYNSFNDLKHYSSEADVADFKLRGRKFYWLKENIDNNQSDHQSAATSFHPLKEGSTFEGKIYFKNLSDDELGLLLLSLKFDDNYTCCESEYITYESFGQGKPYGFGRSTISIDEIGLFDWTSRYRKDGEGIIRYSAADKLKEIVTKYKNSYYEEYKKITNIGFNNVDNDIIWAYRASKMIGEPIDKSIGKAEFEYMGVRDFRNRPILRNVNEYTENLSLKKLLTYNYTKKSTSNIDFDKWVFSKEVKYLVVYRSIADIKDLEPIFKEMNSVAQYSLDKLFLDRDLVQNYDVVILGNLDGSNGSSDYSIVSNIIDSYPDKAYMYYNSKNKRAEFNNPKAFNFSSTPVSFRPNLLEVVRYWRGLHE